MNVTSTPLTPTPQLQAKIWKAASDFEAMTISQMIQPMFQTVDTSKDMFGGGTGEEQLKPMLVNEMAKQMESAGGIGLKDALYRQMLTLQENAK